LGCSYLPLERWGDNHLSNSAQTKKGGENMDIKEISEAFVNDICEELEGYEARVRFEYGGGYMVSTKIDEVLVDHKNDKVYFIVRKNPKKI
jgi:hypothetical protein